MHVCDFTFKGRDYKADNTGEFINGEALWEISDFCGFVDTVTVHPLSTITDTLTVWAKS